MAEQNISAGLINNNAGSVGIGGTITLLSSVSLGEKTKYNTGFDLANTHQGFGYISTPNVLGSVSGVTVLINDPPSNAMGIQDQNPLTTGFIVSEQGIIGNTAVSAYVIDIHGIPINVGNQLPTGITNVRFGILPDNQLDTNQYTFKVGAIPATGRI